MLSIRRPTEEQIAEFLAGQSKLGLTWSSVGAMADSPPAGYVVDHSRIKLGEGEAVFSAARSALERWEQFRLGWVEVWPAETPIQAGKELAVLARSVGLWWLNACRIIQVVDEPGPLHRFGFAYGTLPDHAAIGQERFLIEWDRASDSVWYDILAFSRPAQLLARVGYPFMRRVQERFRKESAASMARAVTVANA